MNTKSDVRFGVSPDPETDTVIVTWANSAEAYSGRGIFTLVTRRIITFPMGDHVQYRVGMAHCMLRRFIADGSVPNLWRQL